MLAKSGLDRLAGCSLNRGSRPSSSSSAGSRCTASPTRIGSSSTVAGASSSWPDPDAEPGDDWSEISVPGAWTMQGFDDLPHYTNVQMPFPGQPPHVPEANPTGVYERTFELPVGLGRAPGRAPRRGRRERPHRPRSTAATSASARTPTSPPSSTSPRSSGPARTRSTVRVVKWSDATFVEDQDQWWHGGITRSVFLYATEPVHLADVRAIAGLADDLTTGHARPQRVGWLSGRRARARLDRRGPPRRACRAAPRGGPERRSALAMGWTLDDRAPPAWPRGRSAAVATTTRGLGGDARRMAPPLDGSVGWHVEVPDVQPWSAEMPRLYALDRRAFGLRTGRWPRRPSCGSASGASRSRARPADQRPAGLHPRRQPPRLRPAHRPDGQP